MNSKSNDFLANFKLDTFPTAKLSTETTVWPCSKSNSAK